MLVDMGFHSEQAALALKEAAFDREAALELTKTSRRLQSQQQLLPQMCLQPVPATLAASVVVVAAVLSPVSLIPSERHLHQLLHQHRRHF